MKLILCQRCLRHKPSKTGLSTCCHCRDYLKKAAARKRTHRKANPLLSRKVTKQLELGQFVGEFVRNQLARELSFGEHP